MRDEDFSEADFTCNKLMAWEKEISTLERTNTLEQIMQGNTLFEVQSEKSQDTVY